MHNMTYLEQLPDHHGFQDGADSPRGNDEGVGGEHERILLFVEVVRRRPDLILGSWCGRKFRPERVVAPTSVKRWKLIWRERGLCPRSSIKSSA